MKVRIEGGGHCVEVEHSDADISLERTSNLAERVWNRTRLVEPRQQMGFGSQQLDRILDRAVVGNGAYESKPEPVTS